ncbi:nitrate reductase molybdenum cofactor assembly chaperone [Bacillus massiliigorillae]|uniref:nitrate reductase molybdenum cofactor assembly chaperone n=1 Tax=Bacillus massiliigorillae TaxID=1243664 RepID=UPI0003A6DC26|nr:nitrate reductase molybdenum cofactor assembly chaperone [Bacillus massiliigorillae]
MISLQKLYEHKHAFGFFAQQLSYPEKLHFHPMVFEESFDSSEPGYEDIKKYWNLIQEYSLEEIEEMYVKTFDFDKKSTLYMTYFKFNDTKERGQMLAKLKVMYEMFGLDMAKEELSDYLPLMCEFLFAAEWSGDQRAQESFDMMLAVLEDGTYHLLQSLKDSDTPYFYLINALRETFKACIEQEEQ